MKYIYIRFSLKMISKIKSKTARTDYDNKKTLVPTIVICYKCRVASVTIGRTAGWDRLTGSAAAGQPSSPAATRLDTWPAPPRHTHLPLDHHHQDHPQLSPHHHQQPPSPPQPLHVYQWQHQAGIKSFPEGSRVCIFRQDWQTRTQAGRAGPFLLSWSWDGMDRTQTQW